MAKGYFCSFSPGIFIKMLQLLMFTCSPLHSSAISKTGDEFSSFSPGFPSLSSKERRAFLSLPASQNALFVGST